MPVAEGSSILNFTTDDLSHGIYLCVLRSEVEVLGVRKLVVMK